MTSPSSPPVTGKQTARALWLWSVDLFGRGVVVLGFLFLMVVFAKLLLPSVEAVKNSILKGEGTRMGRIVPAIILGVFATLCTIMILRSVRKEYDQRERKQAEDRLQAARTEQAKEFKDLLDRFASPDEKTRIYAALRLGEFAQKLSPGAEPGGVRNDTHYPLFLPATSALSVGLIVEESVQVRQAMLEAIRGMAEFARNGQEREDCLLYSLIEKAAHANRTTKDAFIDALADYAAFADLSGEATEEKPDTLLARLVTLTAFTDKPETTRICLQNLMETDRYKAPYQMQLARPKAKEPEAKDQTERRLSEKVEESTARLRDTRDALAVCLNALVRPHELPPEDEEPEEIQKYVFVWRRSPHIDLKHCFLAGASLHRAHLEGLFMNGAHLEGSDLCSARLESARLGRTHLERANLSGAHLENAHLDGSFLDGADLNRAQLVGAYLIRAHLGGTDLRSAHLTIACVGWASLEGANLTSANLDRATLVHAHLEGANFSGANLRGCRIFGATHGEFTLPDGSVHPTDFTGAKRQILRPLFPRQKLRAIRRYKSGWNRSFLTTNWSERAQ